MRAVPIPGEILRTTHLLGLTFDEILTLGALPLVVVFPMLFVEQIPLPVTLGIVLLSVVGVVAIIIRTPDGQTPLEWAPAALKRRFTPDVYYVKPRIRNRDPAVHMDVVHTAARIADADGTAARIADADGTADGTVDANDVVHSGGSSPSGDGAVASPTSDGFEDTAFESVDAGDASATAPERVPATTDRDTNAVHSQIDD